MVEHPVHRWLVEAGIHHEWHDLHTLRPRNLEHACVHLSANGASRVHHEHLRRDDCDLVSVPYESLDALLTTEIPQAFQALRVADVARATERCSYEKDA